ncbi:amino acid transporter [Aspergillus nomiae NRRL 13137]|uniref:Amino acid transporter n=1 Tax=Aspergillus nomiae NRRL (strain ATCC 15546 / NRRL 13137 / CBS 260.88 / M93) TaxID=1509407 RepID=A0A0L1J3G1_ASPN3|nr:amino acid transporter [Aspergillus nomiae NRRL 13137]KNG86210.1 amino acid transporter [Aspergillus nomiae NRRL 13137]
MVTNVGPQEDAERPLLADSPEPSYEAVAAPTSASDVAPRATFRRNLGAMEAFGIVISIVIGSGVFTSPGAIDTNVPSPGAALIVWLVGGLLAWTGATTMAELGTAISGEGGVQPYLQYAFGDILGFLAAWTWIIAVMPATLAILSIVFIESIYSAAGITNQAASIQHKLLSILVLIAIGVANSISTKVSTRLSSFFVTTKFATITGIVLAGLLVVLVHLSSTHWDGPATDWYTKSWFGYRDSLTPDGKEIHWSDLAGWEVLGHYSAALYGALWAYSGWDKAELSAPASQLPLAINMAVPIVILCFIAANTAYYILLPWSVVSTTDSVAVTAITHLLGPVAGVIAAVLICLVVAGSLLGNSFVAGRMIVAASNSNWLPRFLGILGRLSATSTQNSASALPSDLSAPSGKSDAPINAIVLSTALPIFYILFGDFRALLTFNGLGEYTFFLLTVLGAIILRFREPDLHRPYKPSIIIPITFAIVSGFVVIRGAIFAPVQALVLLSLWIIGVGYYEVRKRWAVSRNA